MKLVAAKCPCCGANIDVDSSKETTKCKFCNQAILIDEAIQKYKVEISGAVEVKNLPKFENLLKIANRNYVNKNYDDAYNAYSQLLKLDPDNTLIILRHAICKSMVNNYIDFDLKFLHKALIEIVKLEKENKTLKNNLNNYVQEIMIAINDISISTTQFYVSNLINKYDLEEIQAKYYSMLDLTEYIFDLVEDSKKKEIAKEIIGILDNLLCEKSYKTGKAEYGGYNISKYDMSKNEYNELNNKLKMYHEIAYPGQPLKDINEDFAKREKKKNDKLIAKWSIICWFFPIIGSIIMLIVEKELPPEQRRLISFSIFIFYAIILIFASKL